MAARQTTAQNGSGVRKPLTPQRPRETTGRDSYAEFMVRAIGAYERRVAAGDPTALAALVDFRQKVSEAERRAVAALRAEPNNFSWEEIGKALKITKQSAYEKYAPYCPASGRKPGGQPAHLR